MKKKLAVLSFSNPFVNEEDGGKIDIKSRLKCLKKMNILIDHYSVLKKNETPKEVMIVDNNFIRRINNSIKNMVGINPISVNNRYNKEIVERLNKENYDYVLLENFNMYKYLSRFTVKEESFLRVHNIESLSRKQLFKANPMSIKGILELIESWKYIRVEKKSLEKIDRFFFISLEEKKYFEDKYPKYKEKFTWLPSIANIEKVYSNVQEEKNYILYYGDLTVSHNIVGLNRFLKKIYPKILEQKNIELKVIGKIREKDKKIIEEYKNVEVLGYVDDIDKYILEAKVIIAPIYTGAGVKIKVLNTMKYNKLLVTTPKGIEGTMLINKENVLSAESDEEFSKYCIKCINKDEDIIDIPTNSIDYLKKYHSDEYQLKRLKRFIYE